MKQKQKHYLATFRKNFLMLKLVQSGRKSKIQKKIPPFPSECCDSSDAVFFSLKVYSNTIELTVHTSCYFV